MKRFTLAILSLLLMGCWQSAYELSDEDLNKDYLIDFIENLKKENEILVKASAFFAKKLP